MTIVTTMTVTTTTAIMRGRLFGLQVTKKGKREILLRNNQEENMQLTFTVKSVLHGHLWDPH